MKPFHSSPHSVFHHIRFILTCSARSSRAEKQVDRQTYSQMCPLLGPWEFQSEVANLQKYKKTNRCCSYRSLSVGNNTRLMSVVILSTPHSPHAPLHRQIERQINTRTPVTRSLRHVFWIPTQFDVICVTFSGSGRTLQKASGARLLNLDACCTTSVMRLLDPFARCLILLNSQHVARLIYHEFRWPVTKATNSLTTVKDCTQGSSR